MQFLTVILLLTVSAFAAPVDLPVHATAQLCTLKAPCHPVTKPLLAARYVYHQSCAYS